MSRAGDPDRDQVPRAMVHRRILDVAEAESDASIEAIADQVSGASMDLVERVLDEYGDPATRDGADPDTEGGGAAGPGTPASNERESEGQTMSGNGTEPVENTGTDDGGTLPDASDLSEKQRETARAVNENPEAPQETIADELGVTRATVSRRLNDIPGFEWHDRETFVASLFEDATAETDDTDVDGRVTGDREDGRESGTDDPERRDDDPERRDGAGDASGGSIPPELAHKVVHACMESDRVSEDEELELLRSLMAPE